MPTITGWTERVVSYPKVYFGALAATIVWHFILLIAASRWNAGMTVALALVPALFLVVWAVVSPIGLLRRRRPGDPEPSAPSGRVILVQFGSTTVQLAVFAGIWLLGGLWVFLQGVGVPNLLDLLPIPIIDWFVWVVVRGVLIAMVALTLLSAIVQCAYLISRLSEGWRPFLLVWSGLMLTWSALRALPILSGWLSWLPELAFQEFVAVGDGFELRTVYYESGPYAAAFLLVGLLLFASAWLHRIAANPELPPDAEATEVKAQDGGTPGRPSSTSMTACSSSMLHSASSFSTTSSETTARCGRASSNRSSALSSCTKTTSALLAAFHFVASHGRIEHPSAGIAALSIKAMGDIRLLGAESDSILIDYTVRTFAESARAAEAYHELIDVITFRDGDTLEVIMRSPPSDGTSAARVRYDIALPKGIHSVIEAQDGLIEAHNLGGGLAVRLNRSSLRATDVRGRVDVKSANGDVWLTSIDGDISIEHQNGRVEVHGLRGRLRLLGEHGTFESSDVQGDVKAELTRSLGRFARIDGDLTVDGLMARIQADSIGGATNIKGVLSPIALTGPLSPVSLTSDRGNVTVDLDPSVEWRLQLSAERGSIRASLPDDFAASLEEKDDRQSLTAVKGAGETLFQGEIRRADLSIGSTTARLLIRAE